MNDEPEFGSEERAVDALITGTLHSWVPKGVSEAEINEFLSSKVELTASEKAALKRVHDRFVARREAGQVSDEPIYAQTMESPYTAMNRENAKDQLPEATRDELSRKRAKLLAELKAKKRTTG